MDATLVTVNRRANLWFLLAALLAAVWLGLNLALPNLAPAGIPPIAALIVISNGIILWGLWRGLARTDISAAARVATWLAVAVILTVWIATMWTLAVHGTFHSSPGAIRGVPMLPVAILLPVVVGTVLLTRSKRIAPLLDATPPAWLIGIQVYRVLGGIFLAYWLHGAIPGAFALPAGFGDVATGMFALPVAIRVSSGLPGARKLGIAWNLLGLIDLAVAVTMGMMTSPGPGQLLARDHPNIQISMFPTVLIPTFAVPVSILLHTLSLRQLRRLGTDATRLRPETHPGRRTPEQQSRAIKTDGESTAIA